MKSPFRLYYMLCIIIIKSFIWKPHFNAVAGGFNSFLKLWPSRSIKMFLLSSTKLHAVMTFRQMQWSKMFDIQLKIK